MAAPIRDLIIGRLGLPTVFDPMTEGLGSEVAPIGDASAVGARRVKGYTLTFPIHGTPGDANPYTVGMRMRRQIRSLMQNDEYRLGGLYAQFTWDKERNGWLVIGEAELSDETGGVSLAEFKLNLFQAFLVANIAQHRSGIRVEVTDRRLSTSPLDYLGNIMASNYPSFPSLTPLALVGIPVGAYDVTVLDQPLALGQRAGREGSYPIAGGRGEGDVISWERPEATFNLGDVVVYDRRGGYITQNGLIRRDANWSLQASDLGVVMTQARTVTLPIGLTAAAAPLSWIVKNASSGTVTVSTGTTGKIDPFSGLNNATTMPITSGESGVFTPDVNLVDWISL